MSLNSRSIAKILREHFTGKTPIIKNAFEHQAFISSLKTEIEKIKGIEKPSFYRIDKEPKPKYDFSIKDESCFYGYDYFTIKFNQSNGLIITHNGSHANVYQIEQIYTFIDRIKQEYDKKNARKLKTEKINKLKQLAIIGNIKKIAKEDKFDFYTEEYATKLKLIIQIESGKIMEIDIPYSEFQDTLKELRSLIQTIRELQKSGLTFRLKSTAKKSKHSSWITHESL
jgi:Fe2+ or Zn2+ uptake regulation protein